METQKGKMCLEMTEQEKHQLWNRIEQSTSSNDWSKIQKEKIISQLKTDPNFKKKVKDAWISQQRKEKESDPLEEIVLDQSGKIIANREWQCHAKNCCYKPCRGNALQLSIEVAIGDLEKLVNYGKYACLKHYRVPSRLKDVAFCQNYFKENKKLPEGAFLHLKAPEKKKLQQLEIAHKQHLLHHNYCKPNRNLPVHQVTNMLKGILLKSFKF
jgi:hypothetical protein